MKVAKVKKARHALTNYVEVRKQLGLLAKRLDNKIKKKDGRVNPAPLLKKLKKIRKMVRDGSYDL